MLGALIAPNFKMRFKDLEPQKSEMLKENVVACGLIPCSSGSDASKRAGVRPLRKIIDLGTPELELHIQHVMNFRISLVH